MRGLVGPGFSGKGSGGRWRWRVCVGGMREALNWNNHYEQCMSLDFY